MKQVFITGASSGIGFDLTKALCKKGFRVWAAVRNPETLRLLADEFPQHLKTIQLDVTNSVNTESALREVQLSFDPSQEFILINNAGIATGGPIEAVSIGDWKNLFNVNLFGLVNVTQVFLPLIRKTKGRIINMGSLSGRVATPFLAPYSASKFAVRGFTDSLRREMLNFGVKVILVQPGPIKTEIWSKSLAEAEAQEVQFSPEIKKVYGPILEVLKLDVKQTAEDAIAVQDVTDCILEAIDSVKPKPYYLIGKNIFLIDLFVKVIPVRWLDQLLTKGFRFSKIQG